MIGLLAAVAAQAAQPPTIFPTTDPLPFSGPMVDCRTGPTERMFGGTAWHVFACSDGSLTILARKSNPVFPAMMGVRVKEGRTEVSGPKYVFEQASASAAELRGLPAAAVATLHAEATAAATKKP